MSLKLSAKAAPVVFLILASLWTAGMYVPYFYSIGFPNHEIQHLVAALQGQHPARQELSSVVQGVIDSAGRVKRAIRVAAYYSAEYKTQQPHVSKQTQFSYLAWFEKRSSPTILVVNVNETDGTGLEFNIYENRPAEVARILLLPLLALGFSLWWFRRRHVWFAGKEETQVGAKTE